MCFGIILKKLKIHALIVQKSHTLVDILFIAAAAVISGADSFVEIEMYGQRKYKWLRQFLELPHGIPSHDTFGRIFAAIEAGQLKKCFLEWIKTIVQTSSGEVRAIDGKTVRRSFDKTEEKSAIHVVSAWANENRIVLGQEPVELTPHGSIFALFPATMLPKCSRSPATLRFCRLVSEKIIRNRLEVLKSDRLPGESR